MYKEGVSINKLLYYKYIQSEGNYVYMYVCMRTYMALLLLDFCFFLLFMLTYMILALDQYFKVVVGGIL